MKHLNKRQIIKLIKINKPFLMIDKIIKIFKYKSATGVKKIDRNEWFFKCHFTNQPLMPGTLIEESMLQTIVSLLYLNKNFKEQNLLIASAKTNFFSKITKPTILYINIKILKITNLKIETSALAINKDNIKIATGYFNYFISKK